MEAVGIFLIIITIIGLIYGDPRGWSKSITEKKKHYNDELWEGIFVGMDKKVKLFLTSSIIAVAVGIFLFIHNKDYYREYLYFLSMLFPGAL